MKNGRETWQPETTYYRPLLITILWTQAEFEAQNACWLSIIQVNENLVVLTATYNLEWGSKDSICTLQNYQISNEKSDSYG